MTARVVWGGATGGTFHVEVDGVDKTGPLQIPNTNWDFETLTKAGVQLTAGTHMLRIVAESNAANGCTGDIDKLDFTLESAAAAPSNIHWLVADHLGTPRMVIDHTGSLNGIKRHDYLPFGEELIANQGARSPVMGYVADDTRQKFTSKERDSETGLDYFLARYYSAIQGRFISPDPLYIELKRLADPQQLNLYNYTRGNPLKFLDPTGLDVTLSGTQQSEYEKRLNGRKGAAFQVKVENNSVVIVDGKGNALGKEGLKALGKQLKGGEKQLFNAITDTKNHVSIDTGDGKPNSDVFFGAFGGNGKQTIDFSDMEKLDAPSNNGGPSASQLVAHETLEGYYASQVGGGEAMFDASHAFANHYFGGLVPPNTVGGRFGYKRDLTNAVGEWSDYKVHGSKTTVRITMMYETPIPTKSIPSIAPHSLKGNVAGVKCMTGCAP